MGEHDHIYYNYMRDVNGHIRTLVAFSNMASFRFALYYMPQKLNNNKTLCKKYSMAYELLKKSFNGTHALYKILNILKPQTARNHINGIWHALWIAV